MSVEVEKINLCRLKIDETFNLCGKNVRIILVRSCNMDKIVGNCKCQVSLSTLCMSVCSRLHLYLSVWAHEPQSCCMASSISCPLLTSIHNSSPTHLLSPRSSSFSFAPLPMAMVHLSKQQLNRKWVAAC